jgi:membrane-associated phospholipid phosphatase
VAALGLLVLAVLVASGATLSLDLHAVRHWMPWLHPSGDELIAFPTVLLPETRSSLAGTLVALWAYPASGAISAALLAVPVYVLWRRGAVTAALSWCVLWGLANVLELTGKLIIGRPHLQTWSSDSVYGGGFEHSFPSGHTARACIVAGAFAFAWPRLRKVATAWVVTIPVALVLLGDHTPTDVIGGLLLGTALLAARRVHAERDAGPDGPTRAVLRTR